MEELMALEQCLDFMEQDNYQNVIVEADSKLIINLAKTISCGTTPNKVSKHWRLIQVFQWIQIHLHCLHTISFNHVWRAANKLADIMANEGVICSESRVAMGWQEMPQNRIKVYYHDHVDEDRMVFWNRAMEAGSRRLGFIMIRCLFHSLVFCGMQATISLHIPGKYKHICSRWKLLQRICLSDGWPVGWSIIFHWFMYKRRRNSARIQNPSFLGGLNFPGSLLMDAIPLSGWYMDYCIPFKREAIFPNWEWALTKLHVAKGRD